VLTSNSGGKQSQLGADHLSVRRLRAANLKGEPEMSLNIGSGTADQGGKAASPTFVARFVDGTPAARRAEKLDKQRSEIGSSATRHRQRRDYLTEQRARQLFRAARARDDNAVPDIPLPSSWR